MTDWEALHQKGETPWDKGEPAPPLREFLGQARIMGRVLVPGCGAGHDVRLLAAQGADVLGMDISATALEYARSFPNVGGEAYIQSDFLGLLHKFYGQFDWVFEHTCFCAIHPSDRFRYAAASARALRREGYLLAIFFINPDNPEDGPPYDCPEEEIPAHFASWFDLKASWWPTQAYSGREGRELMQLWQKVRD